MSRLNVPSVGPRTHEGAPSVRVAPIDALRRSVLSYLLWEDNFYENGVSIADRIAKLVDQCDKHDVLQLAIQARNDMHLRHVPLMLIRTLLQSLNEDKLYAGDEVGNTLVEIIQRPDEMGEFLTLYWGNSDRQASKHRSLPKQVKRGLGMAFRKFDEYQLAKYNRPDGIKLKDVLFMVHAKPKDNAQAEMWKRLVDGKLSTPDTWEVALSGGANKCETFVRLLTENKLGYMALLRNLRNMFDAGVPRTLVEHALKRGAEKSKALPFRFIAAARAVPAWEQMLDEAMQLSMGGMERMSGRNIVLVDVSGSMRDKLSSKSDITRQDAANALAALIRGICDDAIVYSFSDNAKLVPARTGMALMDAINASQRHNGTYLGQAIQQIHQRELTYDRIIVITDEQSADAIGSPQGRGKGYIVNVAPYQNGIQNGTWTRINGFSEAVLRYIQLIEQQ